jgi:RHS repeat-associated protein
VKEIGPVNSGWSYNFLNHRLELEMKQGVDISENCLPTEDLRVFRMYLVLADGSTHVLHLAGAGNEVSDAYRGDGFFEIGPNGSPSDCGLRRGLQPYDGWLTYYTSDGSYLKVETYSDLSVDPATQRRHDWTQQYFYVYFPDGKRIEGYGAGTAETLYDANGNRIRFINACTDFPNCTEVHSSIVDDSNREIRITRIINGAYGLSDTDVITANGPNGVMTWTLNWGLLEIGGGERKYHWSESEQMPEEDLYVQLWVLKYIQLPLTAAVAMPAEPPIWNSYKFGYSDNSLLGYGELNFIRMPGNTQSGAEYRYRWINEGAGVVSSESIAHDNRVTEKTISHDGIADELRWTFTRDVIVGNGRATVRNPDGGETAYWYNPPAQGFWARGLVYRIDEPYGYVRKRVWAQNAAWGLRGGISLSSNPNNPYIQTETVTAGSTSGQPKTAVSDFAYDKNGNPLQRTDYEWVDYNPNAVETGVVARRQTSSAFWLTAPSATLLTDSPVAYWKPQSPSPAPPSSTFVPPVRRLNAVRRNSISDASSTVAITEFDYDDPLTKGNVTAEKHWDNVKSSGAPALGQLSTSNARVFRRDYDAFGNLTDIYEPAVQTHITYSDSGNVPRRVDYAFATPAQRSRQYSWSPDESAIVAKVDLDNNLATVYTYDAVGRQRTATESGLRKTETFYDDQTLSVTVKRDVSSLGDGKLQTETQIDQLGRPIMVRILEPGNADGIKVKTTYMTASGRVIKSTPYRTLSDSTLEWTCTQMDQLNRVTALATFNSEPSDCESSVNRTGITRTAYDADTTTITDPALKVRQQGRDALGRIMRVLEYPSSNQTYCTAYQYDALNNLTKVNQGTLNECAAGVFSQPARTFVYSSLSLLRSASNPETAGLAVTYTYWDNGELRTRTDPRGVITTYTYDEMHRVRTKTYTNDPQSTPAATYTYYLPGSGDAPKIGQLQSVASANGSIQYDSYDGLGRVTATTHAVAGYPGTLTMSYTYWLNDSVKSMTYPAGRVVNYSVDDTGRVNRVYTSTKSYADLTIAPQPFTADGRIAQMKLGNDLWETRTYAKPGVPTVFKVGVALDAADLLQLEYNYSATQNNGNLVSHRIVKPGKDWKQSYAYDGVNRLICAAEASNTAPGDPCTQGGWRQTFGYDAYGNRWLSSTAGLSGVDIHEPTAPSNFDVAANRLNVAGSFYDSAGNQTVYTPYTLTYDAENRNTAATSSSNGSGTFVYDAEGRRIKKTWTSGTTTTTTYFFYDAMGELAAEYSSSPGTSTGTTYLHNDLLGSIRLVTGDKPPSGPPPILECYDYVPFGRMLNSSDNGRDTGCYPLTPDTQITSRLPQKFTGKERDAETRLDFFGARYFSSPQGRFMSVDPLMASASIENGQTWNRYAYARNNPFRYVDPLGLFPSPTYNCLDNQTTCLSDEQRRILENSSIVIGKQTYSGETLWNKLTEAQQNAFVNITDKLASIELGGRINALSQVTGLTELLSDRIYANVESSLEGIVSRLDYSRVPAHKDPFNGPSFKSGDAALGNIQFTFTRDGSRADIDIDIGNIAAKRLEDRIVGTIVHTGEVMWNEVLTFGTAKTDQNIVRRVLLANPRIGITPSVDAKWNRK